MSLIRFNAEKCTLCATCIEKCPFGALSMGSHSIEVNEKCRMCGICVRNCEQKAIEFEQKANAIDKKEWKDFLIFVEQENGEINPVAYELLGEARKMASKIGYQVKCVIVGSTGTKENAERLLQYGADRVYVYEHKGFEGFKADCYTDAVADCISTCKPSAVLIGATSLGRSLAPRLATRFHTGLTADCTVLDIQDNSDMIQIRPAFGGNIMAQIQITQSRPQFATVRYRVMDKAAKVENPTGVIEMCQVLDEMVASRIEIVASGLLEKTTAIEEAERIVVVGRGVHSEEGLSLCRELADVLDAKLAYTRPMVEKGIGDQLYQIGLSGHTVRPQLLITCGVSGAIQFTSCIQGADVIVAINTDPEAQIFNCASYCLVDDLYDVVPELIKKIQEGKEK